VGVRATTAVKLKVPDESLCEPVHVYEVVPKPFFIPYVFVNVCGVPTVGVNVPVNFSTT